MASINEKTLIDTHKDAENNFKHASKSELTIDAYEVLNLLDSMGFEPIGYIEQGYERSKERTGKGYYTVNFKSKGSNVGIMMIDSKDAQSSLKVFAGVWIGDRVFPISLVEEIKHRKHDRFKVSALHDRMPAKVNASLWALGQVLNALNDVRLSPSLVNNLSIFAAVERCKHPNYKKLPKGMGFASETSLSAREALFHCLATYADVRWPRHHVKLSLNISEKIIKAVLG